MTGRTNRREQIVEEATNLFTNHGYNATSVRQISDAVGCTEAAIYYHFKDKRALLQEVVECNLPDFLHILDDVKEADSLPELISGYGYGVARMIGNGERIQKMRWILLEFPNLSPEEQTLFHNKFLRLQKELSASIERFINDKKQADNLAWTLICAGFGYGQLFHNLGLTARFDFQPEQLIKVLTQIVD
jgi:AcrR family transcriptional regulator